MSEQFEPNPEEFERQFREDSNFWWRVEPGYAQNAYADALERINDLRSEIAAHQCTEVALREEVARLTTLLLQCRSAVSAAIGDEDGLDGRKGSALIRQINRTLSPTHAATPDGDGETHGGDKHNQEGSDR